MENEPQPPDPVEEMRQMLMELIEGSNDWNGYGIRLWASRKLVEWEQKYGIG